MKLINAKCPNCDAVLNLKKGEKIQFCPYCGNQILLDDGSATTTTNINHKYVDEAELKKAELEHDILLKQCEQNQNQINNNQQSNKTLMNVWIVSLVVCLIFGFIHTGFWGLLLINFVLGAIIVAVKGNKK